MGQGWRGAGQRVVLGGEWGYGAVNLIIGGAKINKFAMTPAIGWPDLAEMATFINTMRSVPVRTYRGGQIGADLATPIGRIRYEPQSTYRSGQI